MVRMPVTVLGESHAFFQDTDSLRMVINFFLGTELQWIRPPY